MLKTRYVVALIATPIVALCASSAAISAVAERRYIADPPPPDNRPAPPFSEGIMVGPTFYVAGHIGLDPGTQKAASNVDTEAHLVLDAVKGTLAKAGLSMDDLVSVTVYCTDLALYDGFNTVYREYFHGKYPARAFIGVKQLVRGARFEIAGIAVAPGKSAKPKSAEPKQ